MNDASSTADTERRTSELVKVGLAAVKSGDFAAAEPPLREALTLAPHHPVAAHGLAVTLMNTSRKEEASDILVRQAAHGALPASLLLLADLFESANRWSDAARCYEIALKREPKNYAALMKLATTKKQIGDSAGATECYRLALEAQPNDFTATERYADAIWDTDPNTSVALRQKLVDAAGDNLPQRVFALQLLICHKEWAERIRRGEMPYHVSRLDEQFFNYAAADLRDLEDAYTKLLEMQPGDASVLRRLALARFCRHARHEAEATLAQVSPPSQGIMENIRFAPAFYDELRTFSTDDILRDLPPLENLTPPAFDDHGVVYLSCNYGYFCAFALPMLVSMRDKSPTTAVHVHIMDVGEAEALHARDIFKQLSPLRAALSVERPGFKNAGMAARNYYHAVRFIRLWQHIHVYKCPLWLMDVDALVNRDLDGLLGSLAGGDVAMRVRPGRFEPWNQFNACSVGFGIGPASLEYLRLLAAYVAYFFQRGCLRWGIDQLAMYGVFADMRDRGEEPRLVLLGEKEVDYTYRDDGFVWSNSGVGKLRHLKRIESGAAVPLGATATRFDVLFEHYWSEVERISRSVAET